MPRTPRPWWRKDKKCWAVYIDGRRHNLGKDRDAAFQKFHDLMANPRKRVIRSDSVVAVIDLFLEWVSKHRAADTYEWYRQRLQAFAEHVDGSLTTRDLRPFHVQEFIDSMPHASGTKRNYVRAVKRAMKWAKQQGYIDENRIAEMTKPKGGRRELVVSDAEWQLVLNLVRNDALRDLLIVTWETGCRPQESLRVEARHVDTVNQRWVFPESESKTDETRIVYLTDKALAISGRLMRRYPSGPLFRNTRGKPWTTDAVNNALRAIRIRMGRELLEGKTGNEKAKDRRRKYVHVSDDEVQGVLGSLKANKACGTPKSAAEMRHEARRKLTYAKAVELAPKLSLWTLQCNAPSLAECSNFLVGIEMPGQPGTVHAIEVLGGQSDGALELVV